MISPDSGQAECCHKGKRAVPIERKSGASLQMKDSHSSVRKKHYRLRRIEHRIDGSKQEGEEQRAIVMHHNTTMSVNVYYLFAFRGLCGQYMQRIAIAF